MTGKMCLRTLSVAVITSILIVRCAAEKPQNADEPRYKNHRTSNTETQNVANKFPAYTAQVYADVSNVKDSEATTEAPGDTVRLYITPVGKRKQNQVLAASTAVRVQTSTVAAPPAAAAAKNPASPTYYVTASKSPVYSPSSATKDTTEFQTTAVTVDDEPKRRSRFNGTAKSGYGSATAALQDRAHTHLLYATTQPSTAAVSDARGAKDATSFLAAGRPVTSNASKPFATVIVPKKMLEAVDYVRDDSSFRPMASPPVPSFSHHKLAAVDADAGRRATDKTELQVSGTKKRGHAQQKTAPGSYRVEEYVPTELPPPAFFSGGYNGLVESKPQDRSGAVYGPSEKSPSEKSAKQHEQVKRQENVIPVYDTAKYETRYGPAADSFAYEKPNAYHKTGADRHREFYAQASAEPASFKEPYSPYSSAAAGKYEVVKPSATPFEYERPHKELSVGSSSWLPPKSAATDARDKAEPSIDDANAKELLKFLLRDVFKSKQQGEIMSKSSGMNEFIDSYFKSGRPNVDLSLDNYDIETDMSCNLRSTKYISDGQCVTTRPIVEAVCADRCLVYSSTLTSSQRQRLSSSASQQVEALHCVDGDVKFVRVQLKCRDGNAVNNVIKVVTNCRCKLHQIQPQVRSNSPVAIHNI